MWCHALDAQVGSNVAEVGNRVGSEAQQVARMGLRLCSKVGMGVDAETGPGVGSGSNDETRCS